MKCLAPLFVRNITYATVITKQSHIFSCYAGEGRINLEIMSVQNRQSSFVSPCKPSVTNNKPTHLAKMQANKKEACCGVMWPLHVRQKNWKHSRSSGAKFTYGNLQGFYSLDGWVGFLARRNKLFAHSSDLKVSETSVGTYILWGREWLVLECIGTRRRSHEKRILACPGSSTKLAQPEDAEHPSCGPQSSVNWGIHRSDPSLGPFQAALSPCSSTSGDPRVSQGGQIKCAVQHCPFFGAHRLPRNAQFNTK